jgi:hypothetical protein
MIAAYYAWECTTYLLLSINPQHSNPGLLVLDTLCVGEMTKNEAFESPRFLQGIADAAKRTPPFA